MRPPPAGPQPRRAFALALACVLLLPASSGADAQRPEGGEASHAAALQEIAGLRQRVGCPAAPTDDTGRDLIFRGRPAVEIRGEERGGGAVDLALFDTAAGRFVSYVCLANASARQAGEAIYSMSEVSSRSDKLVRALVPKANLALEGIQRSRESGGESVYYEARYAPPPGEVPFLEPPVRLLLNASTGSLFKFEIDADWIDPAVPPRVRISQKASRRIAAVVLKNQDLGAVFGQGAALGKIAAADLFTIRPNGWLGRQPVDSESRMRVAWVVLFTVEGADAPGPHSLFIDAATGRVLGGLPGGSAAPPP
jgi:hypothetical protein